MPTAISAGPSAVQLSAAASAEVAAQAMDENASAKVAMREEVCRRRNWLRLAWVRKQIWTSVAAAAAVRMPSAETKAANGDSKASTATIGANTSAIMPITASILARSARRGAIGALAIRSGASSPEIDSQARPPAS